MTSSLEIVIRHLESLKEAALNGPASPAAKRQLLDSYFAASPSILQVDAKIAPVINNQVVGEWVIAPNAHNDRRLLYIHGGSWMAGSPCGYRPLAARISANTACAVLTVDYRLAPEAPYPAGLEDCQAAYQWMLANGPDGPNQIDAAFVAGDSAGGNLALALCQLHTKLGLALPAAVATFSPATDLHFNHASIQENADRDPILIAAALPLLTNSYIQGKASLDNPCVSPIYADPASWPPLIIQGGTREVLYNDAVAFAERVQPDGHCIIETYADMPHVFQGFAPFLPQANQALTQVGKFFESISQ